MKKIIFLIVIIVFIPPIQIYAAWHLKMFSGGFFYTVLNVNYAPHDYKNPIWLGMLKNGRPVKVDLEHKYKGFYDVYISGDVIKDKSLEFDVAIKCGEHVIIHSSEADILATDWLREARNELVIGRYLIEDQKNFYDCQIEFAAEDFDTPIFMRIEKWQHW